MNIIFIIYIFLLFVITSPNLFIKISKLDRLSLSILHGLLFTLIIYLTHDIVLRYREGVKIGTIHENGHEKDLHFSTDLGLDKLVKPNVSPDVSNEVIVNNTILDYSNYKDPIIEMSPLPGPLPNSLKTESDITVEENN